MLVLVFVDALAITYDLYTSNFTSNILISAGKYLLVAVSAWLIVRLVRREGKGKR